MVGGTGEEDDGRGGRRRSLGGQEGRSWRWWWWLRKPMAMKWCFVKREGKMRRGEGRKGLLIEECGGTNDLFGRRRGLNRSSEVMVVLLRS